MDKAFVIKDEQGNFVGSEMTLALIEGEWYYLYHTGISDGFTGFTNPERAKIRLNEFQGISDRHKFGKTFSLELISDYDIPEGETICNKIIPVEAVA